MMNTSLTSSNRKCNLEKLHRYKMVLTPNKESGRMDIS